MKGTGIMGIKKVFILAVLTVFYTVLSVNADEVYRNHLRSDFLNNSSVIYAVNIRTFNAQDKNNNGIIDFDENEISGNFINAIDRLDDLKTNGITALHLLPITPVGKIKALGTAGSLYSAASFNTLNPQLKDPNSSLSLEDQAKQFIKAAHDRGIAVIIDVPGCGSYDLFLQKPELFVKDASAQPVIPADWTDVRLLNAGDENNVNKDVLNAYKEFVDMVMNLGADGIRADVAHSKPAKFWEELITYSRKRDPQFLWLAESSNSWKDAVSPQAVFTPYDKLLKAGFDGYYGSYFNLKNWKTASDLKKQVLFDQKLEKTIGDKKSVIGSFTTHDELSPILEKGPKYSNMILWLNSTLPLNSYFVDGFETGDSYNYFWANKKALKTYTDDDYYFVHRGKIDIFNFSRKPGGNFSYLQSNFATANKLKTITNEVLKSGKLKFINVLPSTSYAYVITNKERTILVIGNLDFTKTVTTTVPIKGLDENTFVSAVTIISPPTIKKGKIVSELEPGEIQVFVIDDFSML